MFGWKVASLGVISITGLSILMLRLFSKKKLVVCSCNSVNKLHAVITGATSGIGLATARELARRKWRITLGCRDVNAGMLVKNDILESTGNEDIHVLHLDLKERKSIKGFANQVGDDIDVLINNAGVMSATVDSINEFANADTNMVVNYLGPFYLTNLLKKKFVKAKDQSYRYPRVVFVSSALAAKGRLKKGRSMLHSCPPNSQWDTMKAYANSKLATSLFARELHRRWGEGSEKFVDVYCLVTGGMVHTNLNREIVSQYSHPMRLMIEALSQTLLKSPVEGCQTVVHCSVSDDVLTAHDINRFAADEDGSGHLFRNCIAIDWPESTDDCELAKSLWDAASDLFFA